MDEELELIFIGGIFVGAVLVVCIYLAILGWNFSTGDIPSQETLDDICVSITHNSVTIGHMDNHKIVCELPSYDHSTNIIVHTNDQMKGANK